MENENVSIHQQPAQLNNPNMEIDNESWQREAEHSMRDWQHYRIQAAIAAMQAELSNSNNKFMVCEDKKAIIARRAVRQADALIEELKKGGQDDNNH